MKVVAKPETGAGTEASSSNAHGDAPQSSGSVVRKLLTIIKQVTAAAAQTLRDGGYNELDDAEAKKAGLHPGTKLSEQGDLLLGNQGSAYATQELIEQAEAKLKKQNARVKLSVGEPLKAQKTLDASGLRQGKKDPLFKIEVSYRPNEADTPSGILLKDADYFNKNPAAYKKEVENRLKVLDTLITKIGDHEANKTKCFGLIKCQPNGDKIATDLIGPISEANKKKSVSASFDKDFGPAFMDFNLKKQAKKLSWQTVADLRENLVRIRESYLADLDPKNSNKLVVPGDCGECAMLSTKAGHENSGKVAPEVGQRLKVDFGAAGQDQGWEHHYATVLLTNGRAALTLETAAEPHLPKMTKSNWELKLYGEGDKNFWAQSWHEYDRGLQERGITLDHALLSDQLNEAKGKGDPMLIPEPPVLRLRGGGESEDLNPTATNLKSLIKGGKVDGAFADGEFLYVVSQEGDVVVGKKSPVHQTQLGLTPHEEPLAAGLVNIKGGKIVSFDDTHAPSIVPTGGLHDATEAFTRLPGQVFAKDFHVQTEAPGGTEKPYRSLKLLRLPTFQTPEGAQHLELTSLHPSVGELGVEVGTGFVMGLIESAAQGYIDKKNFKRDMKEIQPTISKDLRESILAQSDELDALYAKDPNAVVYVNTHLDIKRRVQPGAFGVGSQDMYDSVSLVSASVSTKPGKNMKDPALDFDKTKTSWLTVYKHYDYESSVPVKVSSLFPPDNG